MINSSDLDAFDYYTPEEVPLTREKKVEEFHKAFGLAVGSPLDTDLLLLRGNLIAEESIEVLAEMYKLRDSLSIKKENVEKLLKELCDLQYVLSGTLVAFGLDSVFGEAFDRVHKANMSKLGEDGKPILREDGKALKGPKYKEADMRGLI